MTDQRSFNKYEAIPHRNGYIVKMTIREGNYLYRDSDPLWLRSKTHMDPISQKDCTKIIGKHMAEDREAMRLLRSH